MNAFEKECVVGAEPAVCGGRTARPRAERKKLTASLTWQEGILFGWCEGIWRHPAPRLIALFKYRSTSIPRHVYVLSYCASILRVSCPHCQ